MGFATFKHESASACVDFLSIDMGLVTDVFSEMRNLGDGTGLMKAICKFADENDMQLILYVGADEEVEDGLDNAQLISWYEKLGFKLQLQDPNWSYGLEPQMIRQPWRTIHGAWVYNDEAEILSEGASSDSNA